MDSSEIGKITSYIQSFFTKYVFEKKETPKRKIKQDEWKEKWLDFIENPNSPNIRTNKTIQIIQKKLKTDYPEISIEDSLIDKHGKTISGHKFDFFIPGETAIEICLGNIKNEFEKDVLKGLLDNRVKTLYIFNREYVTGKDESLFGIDWMKKPGSKSIIELANEYDLEVIPISLLTS
jgi:hypothetical protein